MLCLPHRALEKPRLELRAWVARAEGVAWGDVCASPQGPHNPALSPGDLCSLEKGPRLKGRGQLHLQRRPRLSILDLSQCSQNWFILVGGQRHSGGWPRNTTGAKAGSASKVTKGDWDIMLNANGMISQLLKSRLPGEVGGGRIGGCGGFLPWTVGWTQSRGICKHLGRACCTVPHGCSEEPSTLLSPGIVTLAPSGSPEFQK